MVCYNFKAVTRHALSSWAVASLTCGRCVPGAVLSKPDIGSLFLREECWHSNLFAAWSVLNSDLKGQSGIFCHWSLVNCPLPLCPYDSWRSLGKKSWLIWQKLLWKQTILVISSSTGEPFPKCQEGEFEKIMEASEIVCYSETTPQKQKWNSE